MLFYFVYLSMIVICCSRYKVCEKQKSLFLSQDIGFDISILIIIFISSVRFNIGWDWNSYLGMIYPTLDKFRISHIEPICKTIIVGAGLLKSPFLLFAIFSAIIYGFIGNCIKKYSVSKYESLIIFLALFYFDSLSILRQYAALGLVFYGYRYIKEKHLFKYILTCFVAFLFHKSAIIAVPIYFIYYAKKEYLLGIGLFVLLAFKIIIEHIITELIPAYTWYLHQNNLEGGSMTRIIYILLVLYCYFVNLLKKNKSGKEFDGLFNISFIGIIFPFVLGGHVGFRIGTYFIIYLTLLVPLTNQKFSINYKVLFMFPFYMYYFVWLFVTTKHSTEYVPFRWYFLESLNQNLM